MKLIGYVRVSTLEQSRGESLDAQEQRIRAYAQTYGHKIMKVYKDKGVSAKTLDRPGLTAAMERLDRVDGLIVAKMDRLTRRVRDLDTLLTGPFVKSNLVSVSEYVDTSNASGRLMLNLLCVVSQWEREAIAERTSEVLQHKRRQGKRVGSVPYGYDLDGENLVVNEHEREAITKARRMKRSGRSLRAIARVLENKGYRPRNGNDWNPNQIRRLIDTTRDEYMVKSPPR